MGVISEIFTWWSGQTIGTRLFTWRKGEMVGSDDEGNKYYQTNDGKRRWVIFKKLSEASKVPAEWHGWLHHTFDNNPEHDPLPKQKWEIEHHENMTGTSKAYKPDGSLLNSVPKTQSDYQAWRPE